MNGRPIVFGEVLFDRFPDGSVVLGGAPFNVAWNLQAFGLEPLLVSRVGGDSLGQRIRDRMRGWGMDLTGLQTDPHHTTGTVDVSFADGEPVYDIVSNRAYDFIEPVEPGRLAGAAVLYHGSLALRSAVSRSAFTTLVAGAETPRFVDVNLRDPWWQPGRLHGLIGQATWVKLNQVELERLQPDAADASAFRTRHGLRAVVLTRGRAGAQWIDAERVAQVEPPPSAPVVDTVGAGDAFASVILAGLLGGWPVDTTLERAQSFASAVVGIRGATSDDPAFYRRCARAWAPGN